MKNGSVRFRRWDSISDQSRPTSERESRKQDLLMLSFLPLSSSQFWWEQQKAEGSLFYRLVHPFCVEFLLCCHHLAQRPMAQRPMAFQFCSMELVGILESFASLSIQYYYSNPFRMAIFSYTQQLFHLFRKKRKKCVSICEFKHVIIFSVWSFFFELVILPQNRQIRNILSSLLVPIPLPFLWFDQICTTVNERYCVNRHPTAEYIK